MSKGSQSDPWIISVGKSNFHPNSLSIKKSQWVKFQLASGRSTAADVSWNSGLFVGGTANPLPVTSTSSPTVQASTTNGAFEIATATAAAELGTMNGTINVGSSPEPEDDAARGRSVTTPTHASPLG